MKKVLVQGNEILLARVGSEYYAVGNRCPHLGGNLSHGKLEGTIVTCPKHSSQFDFSDRQVVRWTTGAGLTFAVSKLFKSPRPLATYNVTLEDDKIFVEI